VAYLEAVLATRMSYAKSMAIVAVVVFAGAAIITWLGRERHAVEFGGEGSGNEASLRFAESG